MSDEIIKIGAKLNEDVLCSTCQQTIPGAQAHCFRGKDGADVYVCSTCKQQVDAALEAECANPNYVGAVVFGLIAGALSGAGWYLIEVLTGYQIGYVALAAGYLIAWGVMLGSGKKRGPALQLISVIIAALSILGASYFSVLHAINTYFIAEAAKSGEKIAYIWVSPFNVGLLKEIISPMGLLIWGLGLYIAFKTPQAQKL